MHAKLVLGWPTLQLFRNGALFHLINVIRTDIFHRNSEEPFQCSKLEKMALGKDQSQHAQSCWYRPPEQLAQCTVAASSTFSKYLPLTIIASRYMYDPVLTSSVFAYFRNAHCYDKGFVSKANLFFCVTERDRRIPTLHHLSNYHNSNSNCNIHVGIAPWVYR